MHRQEDDACVVARGANRKRRPKPPISFSAIVIAKKTPLIRNSVERGAQWRDSNTVQSCFVLYLLRFSDYILLAPAQKLEELFPRPEPLGTSTIDFLNSARELLLILLLVRSDTH
jgi:hypothetical protein